MREVGEGEWGMVRGSGQGCGDVAGWKGRKGEVGVGGGGNGGSIAGEALVPGL
eukprot:CAMPEP_0196663456 /NCGR_PEP_ID=MMETSP1086-20130531/52986_1 /TAXON_ID=77921 /ORGANISM="Cyanoptyche  gloeocystis , Strain SAG4.97" /LENGTH=52 /DNA_ID=CAMNT_0041999281 /DNA_START=182 /DNA_END=336 /DNA_ORIENTATION=-